MDIRCDCGGRQFRLAYGANGMQATCTDCLIIQDLADRPFTVAS
jgi:hypothetical protein